MAWFKADVRGFLRDEKLENVELRGAWVSLLALTKLCNHNGLLIDSLETALDDPEICRQARILQTHLDTLRAFDLTNIVTIGVTKVTNIPNWLKYQPEYDRQKPYRQEKRDKLKAGNKIVTPLVTMTHIETREGEGDLRKRLETKAKSNGKGGTIQTPEKLSARIDDFYRTLDKGNLGDKMIQQIKGEISKLETQLEQLKDQMPNE